MKAPDHIQRFRFFCLAEGLSWIALLAAMVVKYGYGRPDAVRWPGMVHGLLFVGYLASAVPLFTRLKWPVERLYGLLVAGFLPFGTFVVERRWLR